MKIEKIKIYGFGKWIDQEFVVPTEMTVFLGSNEAGKSTLMAFITGMLFGFASKKSKFINTYEPKKEAIYGGEIEFRHQNHQYRLIRKYRTNSELQIIDLITHNEIANPQIFLDSVLSPITSETFQQIYAINADELAEIRSLKPSEMEQRLLKIGAVGAVEWLQVADKFEKEAQSLFAANSKNGKRALNLLLTQYRQAVDNQLVIQRQLPTYFASIASLKNLKQTIDELQNTIEKVQTKILDLDALARVEPIYQEVVKLNSTQRQRIERINAETKQRFEQLQFQKGNLIEELNQLEQQSVIENADKINDEELSNTIKDLQLSMGQDMELAAHYQVALQNTLVSEQTVRTLATKIDELKEKNNPNKMLRQPTVPTSRINWAWLSGTMLAVLVILFLLPFSIGLKIILVILIGGIGTYIAKNKVSTKVSIPTYVQNNELDIEHDYLLDQYELENQRYKNFQQNLQLINSQIIARQQQINELRITGIKLTIQPDEFNGQLQQISQFIAEFNQQQAAVALGHADEVYHVQYYKQREQQLAQINREMKTVLTSIGLTDEAEFHLQLVKQKVDDEQNQRLATLMQQLTAEQLATLKALKIPIIQQRSQLEEDIAQTKLQLDALNKQYHDAQLQHLKVVNNGTISEVQQQVANLEHDVLQGINDYFVKQLTAQWINEALKQSSQQRMPQIIERATKYLQMLTGGNFIAIDVQGNSIKLVTTQHIAFTLAELSKGTSEQLYVSLRIAFAEILADLIEFPIVIDDGFVNFDAVRLQRMHGIMHDISSRQQVIYFTSNTVVRDDFESSQIIEL